MGKAYRELTGEISEPTTNEAMRVHCQRPGTFDKDGKIVYMTEQSHKNECDVNLIIKKYDRNGLIDHISRMEARFGDATALEFKEAMDLVTGATDMFNNLPAEIRGRFQNNPENLIGFMDNPDNREEAIKLGLIRGEWTPETDGLGEHIKDDSERKKIDSKEPNDPPPAEPPPEA